MSLTVRQVKNHADRQDRIARFLAERFRDALRSIGLAPFHIGQRYAPYPNRQAPEVFVPQLNVDGAWRLAVAIQQKKIPFHFGPFRPLSDADILRLKQRRDRGDMGRAIAHFNVQADKSLIREAHDVHPPSTQ